jgi:hypothetical protein
MSFSFGTPKTALGPTLPTTSAVTGKWFDFVSKKSNRSRVQEPPRLAALETPNNKSSRKRICLERRPTVLGFSWGPQQKLQCLLCLLGFPPLQVLPQPQTSH